MFYHKWIKYTYVNIIFNFILIGMTVLLMVYGELEKQYVAIIVIGLYMGIIIANISAIFSIRKSQINDMPIKGYAKVVAVLSIVGYLITNLFNTDPDNVLSIFERQKK